MADSADRADRARANVTAQLNALADSADRADRARANATAQLNALADSVAELLTRTPAPDNSVGATTVGTGSAGATTAGTGSTGATTAGTGATGSATAVPASCPAEEFVCTGLAKCMRVDQACASDTDLVVELCGPDAAVTLLKCPEPTQSQASIDAANAAASAADQAAATAAALVAKADAEAKLAEAQLAAVQKEMDTLAEDLEEKTAYAEYLVNQTFDEETDLIAEVEEALNETTAAPTTTAATPARPPATAPATTTAPTMVPTTAAPTCATTAGGSRQACSNGYAYDASKATAASPSNAVCCKYVPTCAATTAGGSRHACGSGYTYDAAKNTATNPSNAACCTFVPSCAATMAGGGRHTCDTHWNYDTSKDTVTSPSTTRCCVFVRFWTQCVRDEDCAQGGRDVCIKAECTAAGEPRSGHLLFATVVPRVLRHQQRAL